MERRTGSRGGSVAAALVVLVLANCVNAQIYTCWGGCYNVCFYSSKNSQSEKLACYYQCLPSCKPNSPPDYRYFCQIGCSLRQCSALYRNVTELEICYGKCTNICNLRSV